MVFFFIKPFYYSYTALWLISCIFSICVFDSFSLELKLLDTNQIYLRIFTENIPMPFRILAHRRYRAATSMA